MKARDILENLADSVNRTSNFNWDMWVEFAQTQLLKDLLECLPKEKFPYVKSDLITFIEPIIAKSINTKATQQPLINKGYNQALRDAEAAIRRYFE